ncbi:MAG: hypothetical protein J6P87_03385 [Lachnospiraceae bacterium]|nr:hypothetical protein [Lachnospiraceae bacterium]
MSERRANDIPTTYRPEIQDLYNDMKDLQSKSPVYARYVEAMKDLDKEMTNLMNATETGWKLLDKETFNQFSLKYRSTALLGEENRATMGGVVGQIKKADYMAKQLDGKTHFWRGSSSQNYQDIEKAVKKYKELQETILKRMGTCKDKIEDGSTNPEDAYGQYVNRQDMKKMKKALLNIKTAANKYATEKRQELADKGKVPDDDKYIKARIDFADEISAYVDSQLEISEAEKKTLDSNDRQSLEDYVRNKTAADQKKENNEINLNDQAQPENERILNL